MSQDLQLDELEQAIRELPGVLGCVILRGVDGQPSEIQAFTQVGTDRDSVQGLILEEISRRDLGAPVSQVFVFELEAESYFGDLESLERAAEFAEQEARVRGPVSAEPRPVTTAETAPGGAETPVGTGGITRPALRRVSLSSASFKTQAEVALGGPGTEVLGQASSEKTPHGLKVLADATLGAVRKIVPDVDFRLKTAALVNVSGQEAVLVIVQEEGAVDTIGAALTRGGPLPETAVRATLDAVNRRLMIALGGG
jgi:hypothetical protein